MSAAPRTFQKTAGTRNLGAAMFAVLVSIALLTMLVLSQVVAAKPQAAPVAGVAPATWDHGTSSGASAINAAGPTTWDHGTSQTGTSELRISGTHGGGILYTGIPSSAGTGATGVGASSDAGGTYRGRFAR